MTWFGWVFVVLNAAGAGVQLATIDQPRKPISAGSALTSLVINGFLIWGAIHIGTTA